MATDWAGGAGGGGDFSRNFADSMAANPTLTRMAALASNDSPKAINHR